MTYYIQEDNNIVLWDTDRKKLSDTLLFMPQYSGLEILETENPVIDNKIVSLDYEIKYNRVQQIQIELQEQQDYLSSTDWYAIRYADTGVVIPEDIKQARIDARNKIDELRLELESLSEK